MITRIEIDGFKSFVDFSLDLHPFTAVIGTNASGKSNLVEALRFLSAAVKGGLYDAIDAVRGDAESLFHQYADGNRVECMRFALEFSDDSLPDEDGPADLRWRYEAEVEWGKGAGQRGLVFTDERVRSLDTPTAALEFTRSDGRLAEVEVRRAPPYTSVFAGFSHVTDLARLRACQFEPSALRQFSAVGLRQDMAADGSGLPGYLERIREETATADDPRGALREIGLVLRGIIPDITGFKVIEDQARRDIRIEFTAQNEPQFEAAVASDGMLRTLAILATLADPDHSGPLLIDEPESGIYPERLRKLLRIIKSTTSPRDGDPGALRQVLLASHSPVVLDVVPPQQVVFLDVVSQVGLGKSRRVTRARRAGESTAKDSTANWGPLSPARGSPSARRGDAGLMPIRHLLCILICEGASDEWFLPVVLKRAIQRLCERGRVEVQVEIVTLGADHQSPETILSALAEAGRFHVVLYHHDGAPAVSAGAKVKEVCRDVTTARSEPIVPVVPMRETEAWLLADPMALADELGARRSTIAEMTPPRAKDVEGVPDPKKKLNTIVATAVGRRPTDFWKQAPSRAPRPLRGNGLEPRSRPPAPSPVLQTLVGRHGRSARQDGLQE